MPKHIQPDWLLDRDKKRWSEDELVLALELYFQQSAHRESDSTTLDLAKLLRRRPASILMKLGNYKFHDPEISGGLPNGSDKEKDLWNRYSTNLNELQRDSKLIREKLTREHPNNPRNAIAKFQEHGLEVVTNASKTRVWSEDETLLAFRLYCLTPFGKIDARNVEIQQLARVLNRTPSAVAMKMLNIASHDPRIKETGRVSLKNASKLDGLLWEKFHARTTDLFWASEESLKRLGGVATKAGTELAAMRQFTGATETTRVQPVRLAQRFFRDTVLASYNNRCAISGIDKAELLSASHIIPWSKDPERRADPRNGISLSALHDRAFDRGLISFDERHGLLVSPKLKEGKPNELIRTGLLDLEGKLLEMSERFTPAPEALAYHREHIFKPA